MHDLGQKHLTLVYSYNRKCAEVTIALIINPYLNHELILKKRNIQI